MNQDIVVKRIVDAPVEVVWKAWTDPEHVKKWWGPKDFTSPDCKIDLKEGGKFVFAMLAPDYQGGQVSYTGGTYKKIVPMERLEFTQGITDEQGNPIDPATIGLPAEFPKETYTEVTFKKIKHDMTELLIIERDWPPIPMAVFSLAGMHQCIDKLEESVK